LVLATEAAQERLAMNREQLRQAFPTSARELGRIAAYEGAQSSANRSLAMIDPFNRSRGWLLSTPLSSRVRQPPYADYAALMARMRRG
jgi:hypothetical protein